MAKFTASVPAGTARVSDTRLRSPRLRLTPSAAVRSSLISSVSSLLKTRDHKIAESFHTSGAAKLCPPDNSAHVSAHNAVRFAGIAAATEEARRSRHAQKLEEEYQKARKRAAKKGRELPPKDEYYSHWGYAYYGKLSNLYVHCVDEYAN